jgi:hypothetical protein
MMPSTGAHMPVNKTDGCDRCTVEENVADELVVAASRADHRKFRPVKAGAEGVAPNGERARYSCCQCYTPEGDFGRVSRL